MEAQSEAPSHNNNAPKSSKNNRSYFKARRAEYVDVPALELLAKEECNKDTFGQQILSQLMYVNPSLQAEPALGDHSHIM